MGKSTRRKLFSVTIHDCTVDTFSVGGAGGSGKDTSNSGVRVTHPPSGAVGIGRDHRSQSDNKRAAFTRMANSREFQAWVKVTAARLNGHKSIDEQVEDALAPTNLRVEYYNPETKQWQLSI